MYDVRKDINAFAEGINFEREHTRLIKERAREKAQKFEKKVIDDRIIVDFISVLMALAMNQALLSCEKEIWNISFIIMVWEVFKFFLNIMKKILK